MNNTTMTIGDLSNGILFEADVNIEKAVTLLNVILDNYFGKSEEALEKDEFEKYKFYASYADIQSLLSILLDYVWDIKKKMDTVMEADIIPDKVTA